MTPCYKAAADSILDAVVGVFRAIKIQPVKSFSETLLADSDPYLECELEHLESLPHDLDNDKEEKWHAAHMQHMTSKGIPRSAIQLSAQVRDSRWFAACTPRQKDIDASLPSDVDFKSTLACRTVAFVQ
jgi:hypothetical protein